MRISPCELKMNEAGITLDIIPEPMAIVAPDGTVVDLNVSFARLLGTGRDQIVGKELGAFPTMVKLSEQVGRIAAGSPETVGRFPHGNRHFELRCLPFEDRSGGMLVRILMKDITSFIQLEKELRKKNKELIIINTLSTAFISSEDMDHAIDDLIDKILIVADFPSGWLLLREEKDFVLKTSRGISPAFQKNIEAGALLRVCSEALASGDPIFVADASFVSGIPFLHDEGIVFLLAVPIRQEKGTSGFLFLASREERDFDFDFASLISLVGNHVSNIVGKIKLYEAAQRLAMTDGLTGLLNTRAFYRSLALEISRTNRYSKPFGLILLDIDNFKYLNDSLGHQAGDEVLQELARLLKSLSRQTDTVVRYGGEEFVIILPNTTEEETLSFANRIKNTVQAAKFAIHDIGEVQITLSGGIASYPKNASNARSLLNAADIALYAAKAAGKNIIYCYEGTIDAKDVRKTP